MFWPFFSITVNVHPTTTSKYVQRFYCETFYAKQKVAESTTKEVNLCLIRQWTKVKDMHLLLKAANWFLQGSGDRTWWAFVGKWRLVKTLSQWLIEEPCRRGHPSPGLFSAFASSGCVLAAQWPTGLWNNCVSLNVSIQMKKGDKCWRIQLYIENNICYNQ